MGRWWWGRREARREKGGWSRQLGRLDHSPTLLSTLPTGLVTLPGRWCAAIGATRWQEGGVASHTTQARVATLPDSLDRASTYWARSTSSTGTALGVTM